MKGATPPFLIQRPFWFVGTCAPSLLIGSFGRRSARRSGPARKYEGILQEHGPV